MSKAKKHGFAALIGGAIAISGFAVAAAEEPPRAAEQPSHREPIESRFILRRQKM